MQMKLQLMILEKERDDMRQTVKMEYDQKMEKIKKEKEDMMRDKLEASARFQKEKDDSINNVQRDLEKRYF